MPEKTMRFNNILSRLLFFNIILILLATIVPQITLYQYFTSQYRKKLEETNYNNIKQVRDFVDETVFEYLVTIPITYFSDTTNNAILIAPIRHDIRNKSYEVLTIGKKLSEIQNSYPFVSSIDVYYLRNNMLFRGEHVFYLNDYESEHGFYDPWLKEIMLSEQPIKWSGVEDEQTACVYTCFIPYYHTQRGDKAVLAIEVDEDALIDAVEKTRGSRSGFFGIISEQGEMILDINQEPSQDISVYGSEGNASFNFSQELIDKIGVLTEDGFFKYRLNNEDFIISYAKCGYNEWKYVSAIPIDDVFFGLFDIKLWLIILCMVFIGLNIGFAVLITKKAHRPMEYIVDNIHSYVGASWTPEVEKNQYKLLEDTFHSLAFQVKDLNEHLSANQPVIYHNMVKRILTSTDQNLYRDMEVIGFKRKLFICFVIRIYHPVEMNIHNRMLVNYSLNDLLNMADTWYDVYSITDETDLLYGILSFDEAGSLSRAVDDMFGKMESSISTFFHLCLGSVVDDEQKISVSYRDACEVKKYSFFYEEKQKLYYSDLRLQELKTTGNSEKFLEKVKTAIRGEEWNQLHTTMDSIMELVTGDVYAVDYRMNTLADFVSTVRKAVIGAGYDAPMLFGGDIREQLKDIVNICEFKEWMERIIQTLIQEASSKKKAPGEDLKLKIEVYVRSNIFHDLTLSKMSNDLGISSSYLSRIFKTIMGVNCSEYLIQAKLDKARELLATTDYTVKEISEKLGYSSTAHFIKIFKENFGCTPKQSSKRKN